MLETINRYRQLAGVRPVALDLVTLRLRKQDIREARAQAKMLGLPYQNVIRLWVAAQAAKAARSRRSQRMS